MTIDTIQSLFESPTDTRSMVRKADPETSHEAAQEVKPKVKRDVDLALAVLMLHPEGLTDFQLGDLMHRQQTSAGKRRGDLVKRGLVEYAGFTRPSPSGAKARVWRAVVSANVRNGSFSA